MMNVEIVEDIKHLFDIKDKVYSFRIYSLKEMGVIINRYPHLKPVLFSVDDVHTLFFLTPAK